MEKEIFTTVLGNQTLSENSRLVRNRNREPLFRNRTQISKETARMFKRVTLSSWRIKRVPLQITHTYTHTQYTNTQNACIII